MNPRIVKWFNHYFCSEGHPAYQKKETAVLELSAVASGLNRRWSQLNVVLKMLDDQSFLLWWAKDCKRTDRKLFRREVKLTLKLLDEYLRDEKICGDLHDIDVGRRLTHKLGQEIYQKIVSPLQQSTNLDGECADFRILARRLERIKTEIRLLVEEAFLRQKIRAGWQLLLRGEL